MANESVQQTKAVREALMAGKITSDQAKAQYDAINKQSLEKSPTINRNSAATPAAIQAQQEFNQKNNLAPTTGLNTAPQPPVSTPVVTEEKAAGTPGGQGYNPNFNPLAPDVPQMPVPTGDPVADAAAQQAYQNQLNAYAATTESRRKSQEFAATSAQQTQQNLKSTYGKTQGADTSTRTVLSTGEVYDSATGAVLPPALPLPIGYSSAQEYAQQDPSGYKDWYQTNLNQDFGVNETGQDQFNILKQTFQAMVNEPVTNINPDMADVSSAGIILSQLDLIGINNANADYQNIVAALAQRDLYAKQEYESSKAFWEAQKGKSQEILDLSKDMASRQVDLQAQETAAKFDDKLNVMRDNNSRLEGYLKGYMAANGMLDSAAGLTYLAKSLASADMNIAMVERDKDTAQQYYAEQSRAIMMDYATKSWQIQSEAQQSVDKARTDYLNEVMQIESIRTQSVAQKNQTVLGVLKEADARAATIRQEAQKAKMDQFNAALQLAQFQHVITQDAIQADQWMKTFTQSQYQFERTAGMQEEQFNKQFGLSVAQFNQSVQQFGMTYALQQAAQQLQAQGLQLDYAKFDEDTRRFGLTYALQQQGQNLEQRKFEADYGLQKDRFNLDAAKFEQDKLQYGQNYALQQIQTQLQAAGINIQQQDLDERIKQNGFDNTMKQLGVNLDYLNAGYDVPGSQGVVYEPGKTGMRTDRNNNPIASKMYAPTVKILEDAGLRKGIDFDEVGDSTRGVDSDGVATVSYATPEAGVKGSIAILSGGQIASWYANPKYSASGRIQKLIGSLAGTPVNSAQSAQAAFNKLSYTDKGKVLADIYAHEAGGGKIMVNPAPSTPTSQLFTGGGDKARSAAQLVLDGQMNLSDVKGVSKTAVQQEMSKLASEGYLPESKRKEMADIGAQFKTEDVANNFSVVRSAYESAKSIKDNTTNPNDDLTLAINFLQITTPQSLRSPTATANELLTANQSALEKLGFQFTNIADNPVYLTPTGRKNVKSIIDRQYANYYKQYQDLSSSYLDKIKAVVPGYNLDDASAKQFIIDYAKGADVPNTTIKADPFQAFIQALDKVTKPAAPQTGNVLMKDDQGRTFSIPKNQVQKYSQYLTPA